MLTKSTNFLAPLILYHEEHRCLATEQLWNLNLKPFGILLEPVSNNTTHAIALAAHFTNKIPLFDHYLSYRQTT